MKFRYKVKRDSMGWIVIDTKTDNTVRSFYSRETARICAKEMNAVYANEANVVA